MVNGYSYRNDQLHDAIAGIQATLRKKHIQWEIKQQIEQCDTGLLKEDHYLLEDI